MLRRRFWASVGVITLFTLIALYHGSSRQPYRFRDQDVDVVLSEEEFGRYITNIDQLLVDHPKRWPGDKWTAARQTTLDRLFTLRECLYARTCTTAQKTVVIGGSFHFGGAASGSVSGEDIWARSTIDAFETLNYTLLYSYRELEALELFQAFPSLVRVVIMDSVLIRNCLHFNLPQLVPLKEITSGRFRLVEKQEWEGFGLQEPAEGEGVWGESVMEGMERHRGCIRRESYEDGIPLAKTLAWHFWQKPAHPLGGRWTLSPEDYAKHPAHKDNPEQNRYIGYSVEQWCKDYRSTEPSSHRPREAFILSKVVDTFDTPSFPWGGRENRTVFADLARRYDVEFIAGAGKPEDRVVKEGVKNVGRMSLGNFNKRLTESRMVIGIGNPLLSPTPYDALCLGAPFINPVKVWDKGYPDDRHSWSSQHDGLLEIDPPHVYHVRHHDLEGLEKAVKAALENPIGPYIPPHLTAEALRHRHRELAMHDWQADAELPLEALRRDETGLHRDVL